MIGKMIKRVTVVIHIASRYGTVKAYSPCSFSIRPRISILKRSVLRNSKYDFSSLLKDKGFQSIDDLLSIDKKFIISELVQKRSSARAKGDYETADTFRDEIYRLTSSDTNFLPKGYKVVVKDIPLKDGGGATWSLVPTSKISMDCLDVVNDNPSGQQSVLELAHIALGLASSSSEKGVPIDHRKLDDIVQRAKIRIKTTGEQDLRGRKASDAAFWFALSGVTDDSSDDCPDDLKFSLFDALAFICIQELDRFGKRSSCRTSDILHMVERIAAAGVQNDIFKSLQLKAAECLETKGPKEVRFLTENGILDTLREGKFELHSDRSLLWIWRFSTRQRKQRSFLSSAKRHWEGRDNQSEESITKGNRYLRNGEIDWYQVFEDPTRPLVLDVGCGMGVSVLGLASLYPGELDYMDPDHTSFFDFDSANFLGADLSGLAINYASSISNRWDTIRGKTSFLINSAEDSVHILKSYPGCVSLCMIQFPTPFKFQDEESHEVSNVENEFLSSVSQRGNMQLPSDAFNGFMVTTQLMSSIHSLLKHDGHILLQSNVEDVAVHMKDLALGIGFEPIEFPNYVEKTEASDDFPKRTQKLLNLGMERAVGKIWSSKPILPKRAATETEVACLLNRTPIHRCLMRK